MTRLATAAPRHACGGGPFLSHCGHTITDTGLVTGMVILAVVGAACTVFARVGWKHAGKIVPSSLPDDLYWRRYKVIRRGSVTFGVLAGLCFLLAIAAAAEL